MKESRSKVKVTGRALFQRIDRKLRRETNPEKLCTARSDSAKEEHGHYYIVEMGHHTRPTRYTSSGVVRSHVDLEKLGWELGVMQPWEELEKGE
jgi:hypothetical protein